MCVEELIIPHTEFLSRAKIRSSRGLVHAYVRDLGHPWVQGPYLPNKAIYDVYVKYSKSAVESGIKKWYHAIPYEKYVLEQHRLSSLLPEPICN